MEGGNDKKKIVELFFSYLIKKNTSLKVNYQTVQLVTISTNFDSGKDSFFYILKPSFCLHFHEINMQK